MIVKESIIDFDCRWFSAEREVKRTKGIHLSHVIDFIEGRKREADLSKAGHAFAAAGFLWERALDKIIHLTKEELWEYVFTQALYEIDKPDVFRPGEQCMDAGKCPACVGKGVFIDPVRMCDVCGGVGRIRLYCTPDGVSITDNCLEEWKYTSKSCRNIDLTSTKFNRWTEWQIPVYLKALNLNTCRLRVYFSRGDYTSGIPQWHEYIITYTDYELEEVWESICRNTVALLMELESGIDSVIGK